MITIKAVTTRGETIEWNYDTPQQARRCWQSLTVNGVTPDTNNKVIRAYYFSAKRKPGDGPDKAWHG